jgi:ArsR family transcriptional regulator
MVNFQPSFFHRLTIVDLTGISESGVFRLRSRFMTHPSIPLDRTLHAIADPTRRRILISLKQRAASSPMKPGASWGMCAGDIEQRMQLSQSTISHHMAILTKAGLVAAVKQGQWRWYRRNEKALRQLLKSLRAQL